MPELAVLGHFMCLEPELYATLNIRKACVYYADLDFNSLHQAVTFLRIANLALDANEAIPAASLPLIQQTVSMEQLHKSVSGKYHHAPLLIAQFKQESIRLLQQYNAIEHPATGTSHYNYRVLTRLIRSITPLATTLREYSS